MHTGGQAPQKTATLFRKATLIAFRRLCDQALKHQVDFIVLAGDVYDQKARSVAANQFF